jgi:pimeloyl-ACP methyl ester carboxylesterase
MATTTQEPFWTGWTHQFAQTAPGVRIHYVDVGPRDAPPVVLVHGWPDLWFGWRVRRLHPRPANLAVYQGHTSVLTYVCACVCVAALEQHQIRALSSRYRLIVPGTMEELAGTQMCC